MHGFLRRRNDFIIKNFRYITTPSDLLEHEGARTRVPRDAVPSYRGSIEMDVAGTINTKQDQFRVKFK